MAEGGSAEQRRDARLFISGHSLTEAPYPGFLAAIAGSLDTPMLWNQQKLFGSSIRARTRGEGGGPDWIGYRRGENRTGEGMDVRAELHHPATIDGRPYDALIITENHALLANIVLNDTVRYLRHFHEQLVAANPRGVTYLFASWLSIGDKDDPRRWIAYERAAAPAWACIATRVNHSLAREGRTDRVVPLPVAEALAELSASALAGDVPGVSGADARATMDRLFRDDVHLTPTGSYYVALVTYAFVYRRSPVGGWSPPDLSPTQARALQQAAWAFARRRRHDRPPSLDACRRYVAETFAGIALAYERDVVWGEEGTLRAYARWARRSVGWRHALARESVANPLHFDAANDRHYWFGSI
jgi:hypothetical protein